MDNNFDDVLVHKKFGKCLYKPKAWTLRNRDDNIMWNEAEDILEFERNSRTRKYMLLEIKQTISVLIKEIGIFFTERGAQRPILRYSFKIDTSDSKSVCCFQPRYSVH